MNCPPAYASDARASSASRSNRPGRPVPAFRPVRGAVALAIAVIAVTCSISLPGPLMAAPPPGSVTAAASGDWMAVSPGSPPLNLIFLSLDTTRQDHLSCYGFTKATTPNLDRLAGEGILFEGAHTPVPVTLPAHATMLTGRYPFEHGVRNDGSHVLPPEAVTLPELLKTKGYATAAVLGAFPLDARFGLDQGFDSYDDRFPPESMKREGEIAQRPAVEVTRLALAWLDQRGAGPFFLWCHYFDPHAPYQPPEPYKSKFPDDAYSGEIASMDASIGVLLDGLRSRGLLDRTVIIVAGDHGEGLDEHGEPTHTAFIYETTQRVPLLLALPAAGAFAERGWHGVRVPGLVDLTDLLPTAWNALGFPREELPPSSGISLLPVAAGTAPAHPWIYHETRVPALEYGAGDLRGYADARWKYIRAPQPELYDLQNDPGELQNQAGREPARVQRMEASLDSLLGREASIPPVASVGATANRTDLKDVPRIMKALEDAETLLALSRPRRALGMVDSLLKLYPETPLALQRRANYLTRAGRGQDGVLAYDKALANCGGCPDAFRLRQERLSALVAAGKVDEALAECRALLKERPAEEGLSVAEGEILEARGDRAGARTAYDREAKNHPRQALPHIKLGILESADGRPAQAETEYRRALAIDPRNVDALVMLSELLESVGRIPESDTMAQQALDVDPIYPGALMRQAAIFRRQGKKDQAVTAYQTCLSRQPDNAVALFKLGTLYGELGKNDEAQKAYAKAITTGKAPQGCYANLGVLAASAGKIADAVKLWEEGLRREPNGPGAAAIKANLARARSMPQGNPGAGKK